MRTHLMVWYLSAMKQFDQEGSRHAKEVRGSFSRQALVQREKGDGPPLLHISNNPHQKVEHLIGKLNGHTFPPYKRRSLPILHQVIELID